MAENYYRILNVRPSAGQEEIKKSYRKLAKKFHPDVNKGRPEYEERFKAINSAYQILGDQDLRREYDNRLRLEEISNSFHKSNGQSRYAGPNTSSEKHSNSSVKTESSAQNYAPRPPRQKEFSRTFNFPRFNMRWFLIASCVTPMIHLCARSQKVERPFPKKPSFAVASPGDEPEVRSKPSNSAVTLAKVSEEETSSRHGGYDDRPPRNEQQDVVIVKSIEREEVADSAEPAMGPLRQSERVGPSPEETAVFSNLLSCSQENDWQECYRVSAVGIEKFSTPSRLATAYFIGFIARYNLDKSDDTMTFFADMIQYHQEGSITLEASYLAQSYRAALLLSIELNNSAYYYHLRDPAVNYTDGFPEYSAAVMESIDMAEKVKGWLAH